MKRRLEGGQLEEQVGHARTVYFSRHLSTLRKALFFSYSQTFLVQNTTFQKTNYVQEQGRNNSIFDLLYLLNRHKLSGVILVGIIVSVHFAEA